MSLEIRKPGKTCPRHSPCGNGKQESSPAPPREGESTWRRGDACAMVCSCQTDEESGETCENEKGVSHEHGPRERCMLDIGCPGRKLQVRGDLLVCQEYPQKREPQQHYREQGRYDDGPSHGSNGWKYILNPVCVQSQNLVWGQFVGETKLLLMEVGSSFGGSRYVVTRASYHSFLDFIWKHSK